MGRKRVIEKKTTFSVAANLSGWLDYRGKQYGRGVGEYLCELAERDRQQIMAEGGEVAERYRAYLLGAGYDEELKSLGVEYDSGEGAVDED